MLFLLVRGLGQTVHQKAMARATTHGMTTFSLPSLCYLGVLGEAPPKLLSGLATFGDSEPAILHA